MYINIGLFVFQRYFFGLIEESNYDVVMFSEHFSSFN